MILGAGLGGGEEQEDVLLMEFQRQRVICWTEERSTVQQLQVFTRFLESVFAGKKLMRTDIRSNCQSISIPQKRSKDLPECVKIYQFVDNLSLSRERF